MNIARKNETETEVQSSGVRDNRDRLVTVHDQHHDGEDHEADNLEKDAGIVHHRDDLHAVDVQHGDDDERDGGNPDLVVERRSVQVPTHQVQHRQDGERQRHDDGRHREDAGEEVNPTREPRVRSPGQVLGPLEDRTGHREVARDLGEVEGHQHLARGDDRPTPDEDATDGRESSAKRVKIPVDGEM